MARAHRHFLAGHVWHITQRCHDRAFLFRYPNDRRLWVDWLREARNRHGLDVLDYTVTSNHVHLLVYDTGGDTIARSLQLVSGCTAQALNRKRARRGGFWEDRYHATAVETGTHLMRCLVYIDLNMVRAGVVAHPRDWATCGYGDIQRPRQRYRVLALERLCELCGFGSVGVLQAAHSELVEAALSRGPMTKSESWTRSRAVGSPAFVASVRDALGIRARGSRIESAEDACMLREPRPAYSLETPSEGRV